MSDMVYLAFYNKKKVEIRGAKNKLDAVEKARKVLKVPKSKYGLLAVELAEKDGKAVKHSTASL